MITPSDSMCLYLPILFQDLYRILLEAELEGILEDVDMFEVEKLLFDHEGENSTSLSWWRCGLREDWRC